jgi:dimethylaniline monooxygenase (N-oxide forming)
MTSNDKTIAIIGAGPAGLVAARFLKAQGFEPTLFERGTRIGGQWDHTAVTSGIWPDMRTNTSRTLTRFSDLDYPKGVGVFPRNQDVWRYLDDYAHHFGLLGHVYLGATVEKLSVSTSGGYELAWRSPRGILHTESFGKVVVASGFCNTPRMPEIAGLPAFTGAGGAIHSFDYPGAEAYRGQKVLIAGANISALEIAADLALGGGTI